jgi:hypothetical protein
MRRFSDRVQNCACIQDCVVPADYWPADRRNRHCSHCRDRCGIKGQEEITVVFGPYRSACFGPVACCVGTCGKTSVAVNQSRFCFRNITAFTTENDTLMSEIAKWEQPERCLSQTCMKSHVCDLRQHWRVQSYHERQSVFPSLPCALQQWTPNVPGVIQRSDNN